MVASFWTPANVKRLQALVQRGRMIVSVEDAAQLLGTTFAIVRAEIKKRNYLPLNPHGELWTTDKLAKLKLLVNTQRKLIVTRSKAATILGCDRSSIVQGLLQINKRPLERFTLTTARKAELLVKLSQAVGRTDSPAEVLRLVPMAFSYSQARIAQRVELANSGKGPRRIGGLLHLTAAKAEELMGRRRIPVYGS